jgi:RNA polymerase sigma factor (sigma-70 family)
VIRDRHGYHTAERRTPRRELAAADTILCLDPPREGQATPSQLTDKSEREAWVRLAVELLDSDSRRIVIAREWQEKPFAQIAADLGISEDAARMRHQRALVQLSRKVGELRRGRAREAIQQLAGPESES